MSVSNIIDVTRNWNFNRLNYPLPDRIKESIQADHNPKGKQ